ncbi:MAG: N-acetyl-gamma-glutamyl-phosphate reductase, partial [Rhodothermales bacterium]|nr:N-acetyl-gamma-glutamyl-phosphate reductase [Rhodothermales bacterium]
MDDLKRIALLHGAGYAGGELIRLLLNHPALRLEAVTSRSFAGQPLWAAHPTLRAHTDLAFIAPDAFEPGGVDAVLVAAEHGQGAVVVQALLDGGFEGAVVDLSADFRFAEAGIYETWFRTEHPAPALLDAFTYGLPEVNAPYATRCVANPGCFATGLSLALWPLARGGEGLDASVTALTGASGSGTRPSATTHFPTREGNVRAYKILAHQHLPEVWQVLGPAVEVAFVPVSGPWTRGIWGTAHVRLARPLDAGAVAARFEQAYAEAPFVRLWPGRLPELHYAVGTPFCDVGWVAEDGRLVVGFALDNLLKGAASQAVQNLNLLLGLPE